MIYVSDLQINETWYGASQVKEEGWLPQHVLIRHAETQQLHACVPLYLKGHSYGEYVFDNSWAVLASRVGQRYYVSCCPTSTGLRSSIA